MKEAPIADVRDWVDVMRQHDELVVIDRTVSALEEMSAITYLMTRRTGSPALLFERPQTFGQGGEGYRHLWNLLGSSVRRTALSLEMPVASGVMDLVRAVRPQLCREEPIRPVSPQDAPVYQRTVNGDMIDLLALPFARHWSGDGGAYAGTADAVFTQDPSGGTINVGTYRMMIAGPRRVTLAMAPGKDGMRHLQRAWQAGKALPVVAAWGVDPLLMMVASQALPSHVSELGVAGTIKGRGVEVVHATRSDLHFPARAELVIEGTISPGSVQQEGPFGEFTGHYGQKNMQCPVVDVTALHHRESPILTNALMADPPSNEQGLFHSVLRAARIWNELEQAGLPGVNGVFCPSAASGAMGVVVVSLRQAYSGHATQALALAAQVPSAAYMTKWVIAVDEDIDPSDFDQVLWAMTVRATPADDLDILRNTRGSPLDPSRCPPKDRLVGSKALINACKDHRNAARLPARTLLRRSVFDRVTARWQELGLPGQPGVPHALEEN